MKMTQNELPKRRQGEWKGRNDLIVLSVAMLFMGVFFAFLPNTTMQRFTDFGGILLCALGALRIISYFVSSGMELFGSFQLVQGISLVAFGVFFFVKSELVSQLLTMLCGMILIVDCVLKLQYAVDLFRVRVLTFAKILFPAGILSLVAGILVLCDIMSVPGSMIFMGISLIYAAVTDFIMTMVISRWYRRTRNVDNAAGEVQGES